MIKNEVPLKSPLTLNALPSSFFTKAWWHLPLSREQKEVVKSLIFSTLPFIFRNSRVYDNWKESRKWTGIELPQTGLDQDERFNRPKSVSASVAKYQPEPISNESITAIAIIIHAFHFDIFLEIMEYLKDNHSSKFKLYITSPENLSDKITGFLENNLFDYKYLPVENRGRDILPFLKMIPLAFGDGHQVILKIHTKKSNHRRTGELWRNDLFKKLLREPAIKQALEIFNTDHAVGLIGASGHIVPMNLYYGANAKLVENLSTALGVASSQLSNLNFAAGSMFFARRQALIPLLNLELTALNFEEENGQKDGTMAHAVERAFAVSTFAANLMLADTAHDPRKKNLTITQNHPFTH